MLGLNKQEPQIVERVVYVTTLLPISAETASRLRDKGVIVYENNGKFLLNTEDAANTIGVMIEKVKEKALEHYILLDEKIEKGNKNVDDKISQALQITKDYDEKLKNIEKNMVNINKLDSTIATLNTAIKEKQELVNNINADTILVDVNMNIDNILTNLDSITKEVDTKYEEYKKKIDSEEYKNKLNQLIWGKMEDLIEERFKEKGILIDNLINKVEVDLNSPKEVIKNLIKLINLVETRDGRQVRVLNANAIEAHRDKLIEVIPETNKEELNCALRALDLYLDNPGKSNMISKEGEIALKRLRDLQWTVEGIGKEEVVEEVKVKKEKKVKELKPKEEKAK
jgi:hypothetical protein